MIETNGAYCAKTERTQDTLLICYIGASTGYATVARQTPSTSSDVEFSVCRPVVWAPDDIGHLGLGERLWETLLEALRVHVS